MKIATLFLARRGRPGIGILRVRAHQIAIRRPVDLDATTAQQKTLGRGKGECRVLIDQGPREQPRFQIVALGGQRSQTNRVGRHRGTDVWFQDGGLPSIDIPGIVGTQPLVRVGAATTAGHHEAGRYLGDPERTGRDRNLPLIGGIVNGQYLNAKFSTLVVRAVGRGTPTCLALGIGIGEVHARFIDPGTAADDLVTRIHGHHHIGMGALAVAIKQFGVG